MKMSYKLGGGASGPTPLGVYRVAVKEGFGLADSQHGLCRQNGYFSNCWPLLHSVARFCQEGCLAAQMMRGSIRPLSVCNSERLWNDLHTSNSRQSCERKMGLNGGNPASGGGGEKSGRGG